jgi:hypothetical protein
MIDRVATAGNPHLHAQAAEFQRAGAASPSVTSARMPPSSS